MAVKLYRKSGTSIFFGIPYGKKFKANIHEKMKNYEIDKLETMFLQFIN